MDIEHILGTSGQIKMITWPVRTQECTRNHQNSKGTNPTCASSHQDGSRIYRNRIWTHRDGHTTHQNCPRTHQDSHRTYQGHTRTPILSTDTLPMHRKIPNTAIRYIRIDPEHTLRNIYRLLWGIPRLPGQIKTARNAPGHTTTVIIHIIGIASKHTKMAKGCINI